MILCGTGQAGTVISVTGDSMMVLLRNGEIWNGPTKMCYVPQSASELAAAPVEVERVEPRKQRR